MYLNYFLKNINSNQHIRLLVDAPLGTSPFETPSLYLSNKLIDKLKISHKDYAHSLAG